MHSSGDVWHPGSVVPGLKHLKRFRSPSERGSQSHFLYYLNAFKKETGVRTEDQTSIRTTARHLLQALPVDRHVAPGSLLSSQQQLVYLRCTGVRPGAHEMDFGKMGKNSALLRLLPPRWQHIQNPRSKISSLRHFGCIALQLCTCLGARSSVYHCQPINQDSPQNFSTRFSCDGGLLL